MIDESNVGKISTSEEKIAVIVALQVATDLTKK